MNKKQVQQRVLQDGNPLPLDKFEWDEKTNTFSSNEDNLVLDFKEIDNCTFKTWSDCTFDTGFNCTFDTGSDCTFDTGCDCTFDTGCDCIFKTRSDCTFKTEEECVIVRRDIYEVIEIPAHTKIKLNEYRVKGYQIIDDTPIGKKVKIKVADGQILEGEIVED